MNVIYLLTILLISFIYTNSPILRKNKTITSISICIFSIICIKYTELFYFLLGLSIIIFFSNQNIKEKFNNFKEYGFENNIGEKLIKDMYGDIDFYPKINNKVYLDNQLIKKNTNIDTRYKKKSKKIIRDDKYIVNNLQNQINKYGIQNSLNDQLYNSEYEIYSFENDQPLDQVNTDEWWEKYNQLEDNKDSIQNQIDNNSGQIIDLENDNKIITQNLNKNKDKLQKLRNNLDDNIKTIDQNQKCLSYGMRKITKKYLTPKKQNMYYGEINAPEYNIDTLEKFPVYKILQAYRKNPEAISKCVQEVNKDDGTSDNNDEIYKSCNTKVEINPVYLPSNRL